MDEVDGMEWIDRKQTQIGKSGVEKPPTAQNAHSLPAHWESPGQQPAFFLAATVLRTSYPLLMYPSDPMGSSSTSAAPSPISA